MEEELRCLCCGSFYHVPVLLRCHHALCLACASSLQKASSVCNGHYPEGSSSPGGPEETQDADKVSVLSDADSGVSCSSRPTSFVGAPEGASGTSSGSSSDSHVPNNPHGTPQPPAYTLKCPRCEAETPLDENGATSLPRFRVLAAVVDKHLERFQVSERCQLCEDGVPERGTPLPAELFCDQCLIFYCVSCRETCHPARGPLADHWLVSVSEGRALLRARRREKEGKCAHHATETVSMYCVTCCLPVCVMCLHHGRHHGHDVHSLSAVTKTHKTELSQALQQLSEKAKEATDFIHSLKNITEEVHGNCREVEGAVVAQTDALVEALHERRSQLINWVRGQRDAKVRILRDQAQEYTQTLQSTTGTIHFCIEALKEADPAAFMEAQDVLEDRIESLSASFSQTMNPEPRVPPTFDLSLDDKALLTAITHLTFAQLKPPGPPSFLASECSAENNSVTVCWAPPPSSAPSGFLLEIDDGAGGSFKEVYSGEETICTIDGLHFDSLYRARVRAFNSAGISGYSDLLCLQTAKVAWFMFEATHPDLVLSEEGTALGCDSFEHRVALGSVGFSRGAHYWEFLLGKYDGNADVAFGVARRDVNLEKILGRCERSWAMYIDGERSWLMRGGDHFNRSRGGIRTGDVIGVLLSCSSRTLFFYVNRNLKGSMVLNGGAGVLYPAVSLNRSVTLTLRSGLTIPKEIAEEIPHL